MPYLLDSSYMPGDYADIISLHVNPDVFTRWNSPPNVDAKQPNPLLSLSQNFAEIGQDIEFNVDCPTFDYEGDAVEYKWNFGDDTESAWSPISRTTHKYSRSGTFNPFLMVDDDDNHDNYKIIDFDEYITNGWEERDILTITVVPAAAPSIKINQAEYGWYSTPPSGELIHIDVEFYPNRFSYLSQATYQIMYGSGGTSAVKIIFSTPCPNHIYGWSIPWSDIPEGLHYVNIDVWTVAGMHQYSDITIKIKKDTISPTVTTLTSPACGNIVNTLIPTLKWTCSDEESGINKYNLIIDTNPNFNSGFNGNPLFSFTPSMELFSTPLENGMAYYWKVRGMDYAGNIGPWSPAWSFKVENPTPPFNIAINSGATYSTTSTTQIGISPDATINPIQMRLMSEGGTWGEKLTNTPSYISTAHDVLPNFDNTIIIRDPGALYIEVGFSDMQLCSGDYVYLYDSLMNEIDSFTDTAFGKSIDGTSGRFSKAIQGDTVFVRIKTDLTASSWGYLITCYHAYSNWEPWTYYSSTVTKTLDHQGVNTILCQLRDTVDTYYGTTKDTIYLDSVVPTYSYVIQEQSPSIFVNNNNLYYSSAISSQFTICISASDVGSGLQKATGSLFFGDAPVDSTITSNLYELPYSIEAGATTSAALTIKVYDIAGNAAAKSLNIYYDNQGPVTSLTFPPNNFFISDTTPTFIWSSSDVGSGLSNSYNIQISTDSLFLNIVSNTDTATNSFSSQALYQNQQYYWRVRAKDNLQYWGSFSSPNTFKIDTTNPISLITSPTAGMSVTGSVSICGEASDLNIVNYKLDYGVGTTPTTWFIIGSGTANCIGTLATLDTSSMVNGVYTLRLIVTDLAANIASVQNIIHITNSPSIRNLEISSVTSSQIRFSFFMNSQQTLTSFIVDESNNIIRYIYQNEVMPGGTYTSMMPWDWKDQMGNDIPAGIYQVVISSLESSIDAVCDCTIYPAPTIALVGGAGSLYPQFSWTNPLGTPDTQYYFNSEPYGIFCTFKTIFFSTPGSHTFTMYAKDSSNAISKVATYTYSVPSATIFGTIIAPFSWTPDKEIFIHATVDGDLNTAFYQAAGAGSTSTNTGTYTMEVAAGGELLVSASAGFPGYVFTPYYYDWVTAAPGGIYEINFELEVKPPSSPSTCPYMWVWDGTDYARDNNIIGKSEMMSSDSHVVEDYYVLEQNPVLNNGMYEFMVEESEEEYNVFDYFNVLYIDHPNDVKIGIDNNNNIRTYSEDILMPLSCVDKSGENHLDDILSSDAPYYSGYDGDWLEVNFGPVASSVAKLVIRTDAKPGGGGVISPLMFDAGPIVVQTYNRWGQLVNLTEICPRATWSTDIVDLSEYVNSGEDLTIKLDWLSFHRLTYVGLDTNEDSLYDIHRPQLMGAEHDIQGDVVDIVNTIDNQYLEMVPDEQLTLNYEYIELTANVRDFIFISKGYYCSECYRPTAEFVATTQETTTYDKIYFDASASYNNNGNIGGYLYEFGDGTDSGWLDEPIASHSYMVKGTYHATLFVRDTSEPSRIDIETMGINILNSPPVSVPEAYQDVEITLMTAGRKGNYITLEIIEDGVLIDFITVSRNPSDPKDQVESTVLHKYVGRVYEYKLVYEATHFGENPVWVTFESDDRITTYETLFCTDNGGLSQEEIIDPDYVDQILATTPTFHFDASASYDLDGMITSYEWDFGDGETSTNISISHTFEEIGSYEVVLTIIDNEGFVSSEIIAIEIS